MATDARNIATSLTPGPVTAGTAGLETSAARVAVVIPIPADPDWALFEQISEKVPIIVVDDSDGKLSPAPRGNTVYYDYAAQRDVMGANWDAVPHRSAATRNFGHYLAWTEGYEVTIALDYDCRTRLGWLHQHLDALRDVKDAPALRAAWINSIRQDGVYARGYPYEYRNTEHTAVHATATGTVKLNMGVWDNVLDMNGIDKFEREAPYGPGLWDDNMIALGNIPVCGMNTAFRTELTPAYFFLPDIWINGWHLSRHDDIWGGYILKKLMDLRGDLFSFGRPVVEHTRQSKLERVVVMEHYMHLMARDFYGIVDAAVCRVAPGDYRQMFGAFVDEYLAEVGRSTAPLHYREAFLELGDWMQRWVRCFA